MLAIMAAAAKGLSILTDVEVGADADLLGFERYLDPLVSILADELTQTPFTIGVFGPWGSGKSSMLRMLDERLAGEHADRFVRVRFNPWFHRGEPNMLLPLLHTLHQALETDARHRFTAAAARIGTVVAKLGANILLKKLTANAVSLKDVEELEAAYLRERGQIVGEISRLHDTLQEQADSIARQGDGSRLVLLVDDLDRCEPDEIIDVLEAIKRFLDLRHVFVVLAVDKEIIDRGIDIRYRQFGLEDDRKTAIGAEYLEKMIQLPLQLLPLAEAQVSAFVDALDGGFQAWKEVHLLKKLVQPNPRKIKRILNTLAITGGILGRAPGVAVVPPELLVRLVVLQVQHGEVYAQAASQPDVLVALEEVYAGTRQADREEDFNDFGARRAAVCALMQRFYRPDSRLAALFSGAGFGDVRDLLPAYLSLLGA
jgi:KAP family P-loop domain